MAYKEVNNILMIAKYNESNFRDMARHFNGAGKLFCACERNANIFSSKITFLERVLVILVDEKLTNNIFLEQASIHNRFTSRQHWLIISKDDKFKSIWKTLNIHIDSDVTLARPTNFGYNLHDVYDTGFRKKDILNIKLTGSWSMSSGLHFIDRFQSIYSKRSNLGGQRLIASEVSIFKFTNKTLKYHMIDYKDHSDVNSKMGYAFVSTLSAMFNTKLQLYRTTKFGVITNGSFDGQIGLMQRREVDVGGTVAYIRKERLPFVEFIGESSYQRSIILFKQPTTEVNFFSPRPFLKPLSWSVWYTMTIVTILAIVLIFLGNYIEDAPRTRNQIIKVPKIILVIISVYCQQGLHLNTTLTSMKMSFMTMLVFSFTFYQFYSASILSSLLAPPPTPIKTTKDLCNSSLKLIIENLIYHDTFFKLTQIEEARMIYAEKGYSGTVKSIYKTAEEGLSLVKAGGYMLYGDSDTLYGGMKGMPMTDICAISELCFIKKSYMSMVVQKGSPLKNLFSVGLRKMAERGISSKQTSDLKSEKPECLSAIGTTVSVGLLEISSAFILLAIGITASMMILVLENIHFKHNVRKYGHCAVEFRL